MIESGRRIPPESILMKLIEELKLRISKSRLQDFIKTERYNRFVKRLGIET